MNTVHIESTVLKALHAVTPVVALETAVLTCGLPRTVWNDTYGACPEGIDPTLPLHLALSLAMTRVVRDAGATPATCAVLEGQAIVGLTDTQCAQLAETPAAKASPETVAMHLAGGTSAGTTVGGSLRLLAAAAQDAPPVRFFATGGIGGVHRNWQTLPDISADLATIARVQMAVVCAGAKSILDLPATAEALQTLGVPLVGLDCDRLPAFLAAGDEHAPPVQHVTNVPALVQAHWAMGGGGVVLVQDPPADTALSFDRATTLAQDAEAQCTASGADRTPALLGIMAQQSEGASLRANIALLLANAHTAALLATDYCRN